MNQLLLKKCDQFEGNYKITNVETISYIQNHLGKKTNDKIKVCLLDKGLGTAKILSITKSQLVLQIEEINPGSPLLWTLLVAWPRPQQAKRIIEFGTSLGVKEFNFFSSDLSEKSYTYSSFFKQQQFNKSLEDGLVQAKNYHSLPTVRTLPYSPLKSFDHIDQKFFLDISGENWPALDMSSPMIFSFGPERGWSEQERKNLKQQNFIPIKVHPSTLKEEVAIYTTLAQLAYLKSSNT
jgi:RsmE family RNA methyltransferase